jgi:hypothetical protein
VTTPVFGYDDEQRFSSIVGELSQSTDVDRDRALQGALEADVESRGGAVADTFSWLCSYLCCCWGAGLTDDQYDNEDARTEAVNTIAYLSAADLAPPQQEAGVAAGYGTCSTSGPDELYGSQHQPPSGAKPWPPHVPRTGTYAERRLRTRTAPTPAETYLRRHVGHPEAESGEWHTLQGIAHGIRKAALELKFDGSGCGVLTYCVLESLLGSPTLPLNKPAGGEFKGEMSTQMYGIPSRPLNKQNMVNRILAERPGTVVQVEMGNRKADTGHSVVLVRMKTDEVIYIDTALGGCIKQVCGNVFEARWEERGFESYFIRVIGVTPLV